MTRNLSPPVPSAELLPFNHAALADDFVLKAPAADPGTPGYWLLLEGTRLLVTTAATPQLPHGDFPLANPDPASALHIGDWQGQPCRLLKVPAEVEIPATLRSVNILAVDPGLPLGLLSLAGLGNAILHWEKTSRCCDNCAGEMERVAGEWGKKCRSCGALHYPRIHPCIIVLVRRGDRILLVRKPEWPEGRFGLVAGFVEFGENLEETVRRELWEETGIRVANIRYQGSQSWPFPSQLMTGFCADYVEGELILQQDELSDGGWFEVDDLPQLPPRRSIARWLIDRAVLDLQKESSVIDS